VPFNTIPYKAPTTMQLLMLAVPPRVLIPTSMRVNVQLLTVIAPVFPE